MAETVNESLGRKLLKLLYEIVSVLIYSVFMLAVVFTFGVRFVSVVGESMEPTLHSTDWAFVSQSEYTPEYGDIIVASQTNSYGSNIIKRVIATEGQAVYIDFLTGQVFVDGQELNEPYIANLTTNHYDVEFPLIVPEGHVFVMGDNRQGSIDSRSTIIGFIQHEYILGRVDRALTSEGFVDVSLDY